MECLYSIKYHPHVSLLLYVDGGGGGGGGGRVCASEQQREVTGSDLHHRVCHVTLSCLARSLNHRAQFNEIPRQVFGDELRAMSLFGCILANKGSVVKIVTRI